MCVRLMISCVNQIYAFRKVNFQQQKKNSSFSCFELVIILQVDLLFTSKFCSQYCLKLCLYGVYNTKKVECRCLAVVNLFLSQTG